MTLAPVFRSSQATTLLVQGGIADLLGDALDRQTAAVARVRADLAELTGAAVAAEPLTRLEALQEFFFLTLFGATFERLGVPPERLELYAELNFCVMGTVNAADNLFDDERRALLPLALGPGSRFGSIVELMCFERLLERVGRRAGIDVAVWDRVRRDLLDAMIAIGRLEGSEEGGVDRVLDPDVMIERVHGVRGGRLFGLATVALRVLEPPDVVAALECAELALVELGTAFQIVDDLADFETDRERRTHNLLTSWIHHRGTEAERALLACDAGAAALPDGAVEGPLAASARAVLDEARAHAHEAFAGLRDLGLAFPPDLVDGVVAAISGVEGASRLAALSSSAGAA